MRSTTSPGRCSLLPRQADVVHRDGIRKAGLYDEIWQAVAVLLPVRTVGVTGDGRTYDQACALRAVRAYDSSGRNTTA